MAPAMHGRPEATAESCSCMSQTQAVWLWLNVTATGSPWLRAYFVQSEDLPGSVAMLIQNPCENERFGEKQGEAGTGKQSHMIARPWS